MNQTAFFSALAIFAIFFSIDYALVVLFIDPYAEEVKAQVESFTFEDCLEKYIEDENVVNTCQEKIDNKPLSLKQIDDAKHTAIAILFALSGLAPIFTYLEVRQYDEPLSKGDDSK